MTDAKQIKMVLLKHYRNSKQGNKHSGILFGQRGSDQDKSVMRRTDIRKAHKRNFKNDKRMVMIKVKVMAMENEGHRPSLRITGVNTEGNRRTSGQQD